VLKNFISKEKIAHLEKLPFPLFSLMRKAGVTA
jgi:hypothetical protein